MLITIIISTEMYKEKACLPGEAGLVCKEVGVANQTFHIKLLENQCRKTSLILPYLQTSQGIGAIVATCRLGNNCSILQRLRG